MYTLYALKYVLILIDVLASKSFFVINVAICELHLAFISASDSTCCKSFSFKKKYCRILLKLNFVLNLLPFVDSLFKAKQGLV